MARDVRVDLFTGNADDLVKAAAEAGIALKILGDESDKTSRKMDNWESHIPIIGGMLDGMNRSLLEATGSLFQMIPGMEGLGNSITAASPMLAAFLSWGELIPITLFIALFAVNFLASAIGVLAAVIGDLIAPVSVVIGLLGLLGIGFYLAAQKAFGKGGALAPALDKLKKQFDTLTTTLEQRFMPVFRFLATTAEHALTYLNKIAKLPLADAFKSLATTGVTALQHFIEKIGDMIGHPIRLAFKIAFGSTGDTASNAVSSMWNQFVRFWLGYTKTQKLMFNGHIVTTTSQVNGAFQPFLDWWDRHDFTKQGEKIANTIMEGLKKVQGPMSTLLGNIFLDSAGKSIRDMWGEFKSLGSATIRTDAAEVTSILGHAWTQMKTNALGDWHAISSNAGTALSGIANHIIHNFAGAWTDIKRQALEAWNYISGLFDKVLNIHIAVPGLSTIQKTLGDIGLISGGGTASTATPTTSSLSAGNTFIFRVDNREFARLTVGTQQLHARRGGQIPLRTAWQGQ